MMARIALRARGAPTSRRCADGVCTASTCTDASIFGSRSKFCVAAIRSFACQLAAGPQMGRNLGDKCVRGVRTFDLI